MWVPNRTAPRVQRTPSVHSVASVQSFSSIHSPSQAKPPAASGRNTQSTTLDPDRLASTSLENDRSGLDRQDLSTVSVTWESQRQQADIARSRLTMKPATGISHSTNAPTPSPGTVHKDQWETATDDDGTSRSSTLDGEDDYMERIEKKPTPKLPARKEMHGDEPQSPAPAPHIPGPLESQLAALMSKLIYLEHENPTISISPKEHEELQKRLNVLEEEKKHWWKRHEAIWALRDEDVENNIKIRVRLSSLRPCYCVSANFVH